MKSIEQAMADKKTNVAVNTSAKKLRTHDDLSSMDEKLDQILKYVKKAHHAAVFRAVMSFIFFLVFIVLPIVGGIYLADWIKENIDFTAITEQYTDINNKYLKLNQGLDNLEGVTELLDGAKNGILGQ